MRDGERDQVTEQRREVGQQHHQRQRQLPVVMATAAAAPTTAPVGTHRHDRAEQHAADEHRIADRGRVGPAHGPRARSSVPPGVAPSSATARPVRGDQHPRAPRPPPPPRPRTRAAGRPAAGASGRRLPPGRRGPARPARTCPSAPAPRPAGAAARTASAARCGSRWPGPSVAPTPTPAAARRPGGAARPCRRTGRCRPRRRPARRRTRSGAPSPRPAGRGWSAGPNRCPLCAAGTPVTRRSPCVELLAGGQLVDAARCRGPRSQPPAPRGTTTRAPTAASSRSDGRCR